MPTALRITKVRYDGTKVHVAYETQRPDGGYDEFALTSTDTPDAPFRQALAALSSHVVGLCEFKGGDVEVRGCSFSWASDIMGVVITALKPVAFATSPLVVNTPHATEKATGPFIRAEHSTTEYFFHRSACAPGAFDVMHEGLRVSFDAGAGRGAAPARRDQTAYRPRGDRAVREGVARATVVVRRAVKEASPCRRCRERSPVS